MFQQETKDKALARIERQERRERHARYRRLTYSPGEKVWIGIAVATQAILWAFILF